MVRADEQAIHLNEGAVYILADRDSIQLVSQDSPLPETERLARRLLEFRARPPWMISRGLSTKEVRYEEILLVGIHVLGREERPIPHRGEHRTAGR